MPGLQRISGICSSGEWQLRMEAFGESRNWMQVR